MRASVDLRDCPSAARVVDVVRRLTAVIATDDAVPKDDDDGSSRWDSEGDGRTAMVLGILVLVVLVSMVFLGLTGVFAESGDGDKREGREKVKEGERKEQYRGDFFTHG